MKFSIVVPIYNTEKYIDKCLSSIQKQTYKDYEVILVNDGSTDLSKEIATRYLSDERFKLYNKENGGQSSARNYGISKVNGDYIVFIDSDDYIESNFLKCIYDELSKNMVDIVKFGIYTNDAVEQRKTTHNSFSNKKIDECLEILLKEEFVDPAWAYCYKTKFFLKNNFKFEVNRYHEDFGLIPYILVKAKDASSISNYIYHYVVHENSIMTTKNTRKNNQKTKDTLYFFDQLTEKIEKDSNISLNKKKIILSFIANVVICRSKVVYNLDSYIGELKKRKIEKYLLNNTILRKIKKIIFKFSPKIYIKLFVK